jgi:hypothetical protein
MYQEDSFHVSQISQFAFILIGEIIYLILFSKTIIVYIIMRIKEAQMQTFIEFIVSELQAAIGHVHTCIYTSS